MKKLTYFLTLIFIANTSFAQKDSSEPYVNTGFVIVLSTKDYTSAKAAAISASARLNIKLDLRDLKPNKKSGLTFPSKDCENEGGFPCYVARGRYDAGDYVSIEWSDAYEGFAKGYYIVITSSGDKALVRTALNKARKVFKDAYSKTTDVYVGCMH